jgi:hypothetical protein
LVLATHQRERAQQEYAREVRQGADRPIPARDISHDAAEVERQGHEDQTHQRRRRASDHEEEGSLRAPEVAALESRRRGWGDRVSSQYAAVEVTALASDNWLQ